MGRTRTIHSLVSVGVLTGLVSLLFAASTPAGKAAPNRLIMGYAAGWSVAGYNEAAALDGYRFTHLIYAFVGINPATNSCTADWTDPNDDGNPNTPLVSISATKMGDILRGLRSNKRENPRLKIILSIGGGGYTAGFEQLTNYTTFAESCYNLMLAHEADGLDIDYEFPESLEEKARHRAIVEAFAAKLHPATGTRYQLSVGLPASSWYGQWIDEGIEPYVDYFTTMAYNYHGSWEDTVHFNSPGQGCADTSGLCMTSTAAYWSGTKRLPKPKIVMGLGLYGVKYVETKDINNASVLGCSVSPGVTRYTKRALPNHTTNFNPDTIDYKTLRGDPYYNGASVPNSSYLWTRDYDTNFQNARQCYNGMWIGYENPTSASWRANWLRQNGYPGIMLWEVFKDYNNEIIKAICTTQDHTCDIEPTTTATHTRTATTGSAPTASRTATTGSAPTASRTATSSSSIPAWSPNNVYYAVGKQVTYNGAVYQCATAHYSQADWNPVAWPGGWTKLAGSVPTSAPPTATPGTALPATPQGLMASARSSSAIDLSWSAASGATSYQILRCSGAGCTPSVQIGTSPSASYADSGLTASTTYVYRVRAVNSAGSSGLSSSAGATTHAPSAPTFTRTATTASAPTATRTRTATSASAPTATRTATTASAPTATRTRTATTSSTPAWAPGVYYTVGQTVTYSGATYRVTQAHSSQAGWEPPNAPALWTRL